MLSDPVNSVVARAACLEVRSLARILFSNNYGQSYLGISGHFPRRYATTTRRVDAMRGTINVNTASWFDSDDVVVIAVGIFVAVIAATEKWLGLDAHERSKTKGLPVGSCELIQFGTSKMLFQRSCLDKAQEEEWKEDYGKELHCGCENVLGCKNM